MIGYSTAVCIFTLVTVDTRRLRVALCSLTAVYSLTVGCCVTSGPQGLHGCCWRVRSRVFVASVRCCLRTRAEARCCIALQ